MQKVIFLVDMNAFFISCEMIRNPSLVGIPAAVAGDPKKRSGIILAANYEARSCGIKTTMVLHEAFKLCPKLILVPPDHHFYEQKSEEVMDLLSSYTPILEQNSIDEAWLDMTGSEGLFGKPVVAAQRIMDEIKDGLGLWCSIGIAENKLLAKMAAEMKKPLGITELWEHDIPAKLWPLPVKEMYGIGGKTAEKLNHMGIKTIGDLAKFDRNLIVKTFGKSGTEISLHANGIDNSPVLPRMVDDVKSIGRSTTLPEEAGKKFNPKLAKKLRKDTEFKVRKKMSGVLSGLSQNTINELAIWDHMFDNEVHGAHLSLAHNLSWLTGDEPLAILPTFSVRSFAMFMNRYCEIAWMTHRLLPMIQLPEASFGSLWKNKWRIVDESFECMVNSLTEQLGKKIGAVIVEFVQQKFPFNEESIFPL
jgi:nucleotidyltransferase/DNA polymerase involved in DNA repair